MLLPVAVALAQPRTAAPRTSAVERDIDPALARFIASVPALDNHAHTVLPPPADATDREFDALPVDSMEPQTDPVALRPDYPELAAAWRALWNVSITPPLNEDSTKRLAAARAAVKQREGAHYDDWMLDRVHVGTQVANRVRMGAGLQPPRFHWVPYDDALLFPLNNSALATATPDKAQFFPLEAKVFAQYLQATTGGKLPTSLDSYVRQVVLPTLLAQQKGGAIAIKFEIAYLRNFDFSHPAEADVAAIYSRYAAQPNAVPSAAEYKLLQDFLFRAIAKEAGRLHMAVHLHTGEGAGSYFGLGGVNPMLLEPLFNDPALRATNFVMLHGSWPYVREAGALLQKPNVYLDISQQAVLFSPRVLSAWLREWLETYPGKVLYATDAYPYDDALGWEESLWLANRHARLALGLALTGMLRDGVVDLPQAEAIAARVLRGNAEELYKLQTGTAAQ